MSNKLYADAIRGFVNRGGRPLKFSSPAELAERCAEYFEWMEANPLHGTEVKTVSRGNNEGSEVELVEVPKMRAMSLESLQLFLGITKACWQGYRKRDKYSAICSEVERAIRDQKFEGAAAGLLNHAIIARDLGLVDRHEHSVETTEVTAEQRAARLRELGLGDSILEE